MNPKLKLLKLWEILKNESDEDCPLSTVQILDKLKQYGIECDRRTLYSDINLLNANGYEVICHHGQHSNTYCVVDRSFDIPELHVLMDAVQAASFITAKKSTELIEKIANLSGSYKAELFKENIVIFNTAKHKNEQIFYNIAAIERAVVAKKKISFKYFDYNCKAQRVYRKEGKRYVVNTVATVFRDDNYYLVAYHDNHDNLASYRIDRMSDVEVEQEDIKPSKLQDYDMTKHRKQVFSMFTGALQRVSFKADNSLIDVIFDKFGEETELVSAIDNTFIFSVEVQISPMFFGWCASFGNRLRVEHPQTVVVQMKEYIKELNQAYKIKE